MDQTRTEAEPVDDALQQRVGELEHRVAELESQLAQARADRPPTINWRQKLPSLLLLSAVLLLAITPSLLVFLDRWLGERSVLNVTHGLWCRIGPLCRTVLPSYFAVAFLAILALFLLVWILKGGRLFDPSSRPVRPEEDPEAGAPAVGSRPAAVARVLILGSAGLLVALGLASIVRHTIPGWVYGLALVAYLLGWFLREMPLEMVAAGGRRNAGWLMPFLFLLAAVIAALASKYGAFRFQWFYALLLILALVNLRSHYRQVPAVLWVTLLALILYVANQDAWWLSGIGDEYAFFLHARDFVQNKSLAELGSLVFNGRGVYGTHPHFSSLVQAASMWLLGVDSFGWRFSNAFLSALAVGLLYGFYRLFVSQRIALVGAFLLAASHYLMSFGKIGYNNLQAFFAMALVLCAAAWAIRSTRPLAYVAVGAATGLCFYVYPAAIYILPAALLLMLIYAPPRSKAGLRRWGLMVVPLLFLMLPLAIQPEYWRAKLPGTFFYRPELVQTAGVLAAHLLRNLFYALLSFLYIPSEGLFVASSFVDPLTGALALIGLAYLLKSLFRYKERAALFLLPSFIVTVFLAGASHDRDYPPVTRMFMVLPWLALFGALGLAWLVDQVRRLEIGRIRGRGLVWAVLIAVLALNLYQAYPLARDRNAGLQKLETMVFRMMQRAQHEEPLDPMTFLFVTHPEWSSLGVAELPGIYPIRAEVADVTLTEPLLSESARQIIARRNSVVIMIPWLDPAWPPALAPALAELGKIPCEARTTTGDVRFTLWHSPDMEWLCGVR